MGDDANGHQLLAVVAAVHHQRVGQAFDDGALGLSEALDGVTAGGVRDVDGAADLDVIAVVQKFVSSLLPSTPINQFALPSPPDPTLDHLFLAYPILSISSANHTLGCSLRK